MLRILLLLFLIAPLVEVYLFVQVGRLIGALPTVLLCILTAIAGTWLFRRQGMQTIRRVQQKLQQGETPAIDLIEGLILLFSGALLLLPGFLSDAVALVCLLPGVRTAFARFLIGNPAILRSTTRHESLIIEGEFHEEREDRRLR